MLILLYTQQVFSFDNLILVLSPYIYIGFKAVPRGNDERLGLHLYAAEQGDVFQMPGVCVCVCVCVCVFVCLHSSKHVISI